MTRFQNNDQCLEIKRKVLRLIVMQTAIFAAIYTIGHIQGAYQNTLLEAEIVARQITTKITAQQEQILYEMLLGQKTALKLRLDTLAEDLKKFTRDPSLCVKTTWSTQSLAAGECVETSSKSLTVDLSIPNNDSPAGQILIFQKSKNWFLTSLLQTGQIVVLVLFWSWICAVLIFRFAKKSIMQPFTSLVTRQASQAAVMQTIQMVAHDIRRPFAMMVTILERLKDATSFEERSLIIDSRGPLIHRSLDHVTQSLNSILEIRPTDESTRKILNVSILVHDLVAQLEAAHYPGAMSIMITAPEPCYAIIDEVDFNRCMENIVMNALEASTPDTSVTVQVRKHPKEIEISVWNKGEPIPETLLTNMFEPFVTEGKINGTGLGLAIAKQVVTEHQGSIRVKNIDLGVCFTILIPCSDQALPAIKEIAKSKMILVVEDDLIFQDAIEQKFKLVRIQGFDYRPVFVDFAEAAIYAMFEHQPVGVICDLHLANSTLNGHDIVKIIQVLKPDISIAFHTSATGTTHEFFHLPKPLSLQDLEYFLRGVSQKQTFETAPHRKSLNSF